MSKQNLYDQSNLSHFLPCHLGAPPEQSRQNCLGDNASSASATNPAPLVAASQAAALSVQTILPPEQPSVVCLVVKGKLNRHTFASLIDSASAHYHQGRRRLLLDLSQTAQLELSGLFALLSIARLYSGQTLLDPEAGWTGLRDAIEEITPLLGEQVKLLAPSPEAATVLTSSTVAQFFESHPDWESALAAFANRAV